MSNESPLDKGLCVIARKRKVEKLTEDDFKETLLPNSDIEKLLMFTKRMIEYGSNSYRDAPQPYDTRVINAMDSDLEKALFILTNGYLWDCIYDYTSLTHYQVTLFHGILGNCINRGKAIAISEEFQKSLALL